MVHPIASIIDGLCKETWRVSVVISDPVDSPLGGLVADNVLNRSPGSEADMVKRVAENGMEWHEAPHTEEEEKRIEQLEQRLTPVTVLKQGPSLWLGPDQPRRATPPLTSGPPPNDRSNQDPEQ